MEVIKVSESGHYRVIKSSTGMYIVQRKDEHIWRQYEAYKTERGAMNLMNKLEKIWQRFLNGLKDLKD